jgi:hypothetical protein
VVSIPSGFQSTSWSRLFDEQLNIEVMKKITFLLTALLAIGSTTLFAQQTEAPKTGAKIYIESKSLDIQANGENTFDLYIVRSKRAGKTTFEMPSFSGAEDITFDVAQDASNLDHFVVTAKGNTVASGKLFYIVTSKSSSGTQRISGTTLSINVTGNAAVASVEDN